jgi:putative Holliday junction resolvase
MTIQRVLGLDVGTKTIGVALGLVSMSLTEPVVTLSRSGVKKDVVQLVQICQRHPVQRIIVGLPLQLDGTEGRSARLARQIGDALAAATGIEVEYFDERFTTVEASSRLHDSGVNSRNQKQMIDQVAAMVILEDWMSQQSV